MSRWTTQFKNHAFQAQLKKAMSLLAELKPHQNATPDDRLEIGRLKKAIKYIQESIQTIDPELTPMSYFDGLNNSFNQIAAYINQYSSTPNAPINSIQSANAHIDQMLTVIAPVCGKGSGPAKAARYAFEKYAETVEEHLKQFHEKASQTVSDMQSESETVKSYAESVNVLKSEIEEFRDELFVETDEKYSVQQLIKELQEKADSLFEKISSYHDELFEADARGEAISTQIENALNEATENSEKIDELLESTQSDLKELKDFYQQVFGKPSADDETVMLGGLKQELKKRRADLDKFKKEQEDRYTALNDEIKALLPDATSAGLSAAYKDMKDSFKITIRVNTGLFYFSIIALFFISLFSVTSQIYWLGVEWIDMSNPSNLWSNIAYKLPLALPVIWLAFFASKRRSEAQRLQQEYAHKEALAKSYQSYKTQVEKLGQETNELMVHLMRSAIDAIAFNASVTLETKHGEKSPLQDMLDKVLERQDNLEKALKSSQK